jgi:5-methylcytosine-specific restriction enzyme subunit McrC
LISQIELVNTNSRNFGQMSNRLRIQESQSTILDISDSEAAELERLGRLLAGKSAYWGDDGESDETKEVEKSIIRCRKNPSGQYFVKVDNAIGAIKLFDRTLTVYPKIPMDHFVHIAKYSTGMPRVSNEKFALEVDDSFWEVIAHWFVNEMRGVVEKGLLMDYKERNDELRFVRGKVNLLRTTHNFLVGKMAVDCNFEEFDIDNPLNRLLRAAARRISGSSLIGDPDLKKEAARLARHLDGVGNLEQNDFTANTERRSQHYKAAIDLAKRVLGNTGTSINMGSKNAQTFLIPTYDLIEKGIRNILHEKINTVSPLGASLVVEGDFYFTVNPDLLIDKGRVTGDVKYKIADDKWNRADLGQATLFATAYKAKKAMIVTFADPEKPLSNQILRFPDLEIYRFIWNTNTQPQEQQDQLIFELRKLVDASNIETLVA